MESLRLEITNPETVSAIVEVAKEQGTTPEAYALSLLESAILARKSFEEIVEPIARSFDESGMTDEELNSLINQAKKSVRAERRQKM